MMLYLRRLPVGYRPRPIRKLYVATEVGGISVYAPGSSSVLRTISSGVEDPLNQLWFDSFGDLYVANFTNVTAYAPGITSILRTISDGIGYSSSVTIDANDNVYVAN
jgi:hypothetical protein